jgi:hypothetical protein
MLKTKVIDLLDTHNIPYRLLPHTEPVFTVEAAAAQRGVVKEEMVKSVFPTRCLSFSMRLLPAAKKSTSAAVTRWPA